MAHKDEHGIWHVSITDSWSAWGRSHIDFCPKCRAIMDGPPFTEKEWDAYVKACQEHGIGSDMATKEVLQSTCDRCGHEESIEVDKVVGKARKANKVLLPTGWLHIRAKSAFAHDVLELDFCGKCSTELINWTTPVEAREGE